SRVQPEAERNARVGLRCLMRDQGRDLGDGLGAEARRERLALFGRDVATVGLDGWSGLLLDTHGRGRSSDIGSLVHLEQSRADLLLRLENSLEEGRQLR